MVSKYHRAVKEGILLFGKEWSKTGEVLTGDSAPLSLVDPHLKLVLNYKPDAYIILKNNKKLIFEVLESELKKQDIIVADVIRAFLVENTQGLIFIHHSDSDEDEIRILEALKTVYMGLNRKGISVKKLPPKNGAFYVGPQNKVNKYGVKATLFELARKKKW